MEFYDCYLKCGKELIPELLVNNCPLHNHYIRIRRITGKRFTFIQVKLQPGLIMNVEDFDFWMFLAGLGLFLFGMYHLEYGLKGLAGKSFKRLLQKFTNKAWKGILTGAFVTAILQSSTLVTLLVLAFLGGGMLSLQSSLGVVMGANVGTTFTAWLVAALGFNISISALSFPFLTLGTLSYLVFDTRPALKNWGSFLIGFGLLFLGLDFMKTAIEAVAGAIDLNLYAHLGLWIFLLIGTIITALIQSSTATTVIVLSALHAGIIHLPHAAAMIIGAKIGTTSTLLLASLKGTADKKRLAAANVLFNLVTCTVSFLLLNHLLHFIEHYLDINEPLMELVFFNTLINLIGIGMFYPFIPLFARFMNSLFKTSEPTGFSLYIKNVDTRVPDIAIQALQNELRHLFSLTRGFILDALLLNRQEPEKLSVWKSMFRTRQELQERYEHLKQLEDEITDYYTLLQTQSISEAEADESGQYMDKMRRMIYAAKDIKDIIPNINQMAESGEELPLEILRRLQHFTREQISLTEELATGFPSGGFPPGLQKRYDLFYGSAIDYLYREVSPESKPGIPVSSMTNAIKKTVVAMEYLSLSFPSKPVQQKTFQHPEHNNK